jgi:lysophospholipase L1-like esterase
MKFSAEPGPSGPQTSQDSSRRQGEPSQSTNLQQSRGRANGPEALASDDLIASYRQIVERAHTHGIRVVGATLTPEEGVPTMSERGEEIRQTVNQWIRTSGFFDAVVDFDALIRDPSRPVRMRPEFDPGDHIHPNDAGNQAMADALDLKLFRN